MAEMPTGYEIVRAMVNDLLHAASRHVQDGRTGQAAEALWAVYENVWGQNAAVTWTGEDARNVSDRYMLLRGELHQFDPELFLPEATDGHKTEDLNGIPEPPA